MHDLTVGSIPRHLFRLAAPLAIGMVFQTLYFLVDLYFIGQSGDAAIAGVSAAGNVQFIVLGLTQILGVGAMALIAQSTGRKDRADATLLFNQSLLFAGVAALATLVGGYLFADDYMRGLGADLATVRAGTAYLHWFLPGLGLQFALVAMGAALRGTGIVKPTMVVQMLTVLLNALLAPILIAGWLTGRPLGPQGAGLASSISIAVGVAMMWTYFLKLERFVGFDRAALRPRLAVWRRILRIGLPPGGEFALMFAYLAVIYWAIRGFGPEAQAGFGVGSRVMQAIFLPAMAIAFAAAPIAGQNVGARQPERVRATFRWAAWIGSAVMLALTLLCQWRPELLIAGFTNDPAVITVGRHFLAIISWNFVATGLIFTCSSLFQALGNTLPSVLSGATRLVTFAVPAVWLSRRPGFELGQLWLLSVATVALQACVSLGLLRLELARRLPADTSPAPTLAALPAE
ncbi:MAG: MATE family efflux transporter [Gemmatimonadales bacterium]